MNRSIYWGLFWKEYRLQRALWIAMAVLTTMLLLMIFEFVVNPTERAEGLLWVALAMSAFYALGCGATLFAGEKEAGTFEFQRSLPVIAWRLFLVKLLFAIFSTAAMFGSMWLLAEWLGRGCVPALVTSLGNWTLPSLPDHGIVWMLWGFFGLEILLWTILFSLLSRRVLLAAILGVTFASFCVNCITPLIDPAPVAKIIEAIPIRLAIVAILAMADFWLGALWFRERNDRSMSSTRSAVGADSLDRTAAFSARFRRPDRLAILRRLVWQHWRQSGRMMIAIGVMLLPLTFLAIVGVRWNEMNDVFQGQLLGARILSSGQEPAGILAILLILLSIPLLGTCAFSSDQRRNSFRFLADRGVTPKYVWLSRQLVSLAIPVSLLLAFLLAAVLIMAAMLPGHLNLNSTGLARISDVSTELYVCASFIIAVLGYVILGISAGQLCSMFFRSHLLAGLFSILLTGVLAAWCLLMWFWGVNWLWSALPIPLALLLATRLRTRDWLVERNTWRTWLLPGLVLAVPTVALLMAVPMHRIHEIPEVDPGFSPEEFSRPMTAEEQETLNLYERARQKFFTEHNSNCIPLLLKASRGNLFDPEGKSSQGDVVIMTRRMIQSAIKLEEEGKLDDALDQYMAALKILVQLRDWEHRDRINGFYISETDPIDSIEREVYAHLPLWAAHSGQAPERILAANRQFEQLTSHISAKGTLKQDYLRMKRFLHGDNEAIYTRDEKYRNPLPMLTALWMKLPCERERAMRLLNLLTRRQLDALSRAEQASQFNQRIEQPPYSPRPYFHSWFSEMDYPYQLHKFVWIPPALFDARWGEFEMVRIYTEMETSRRATRLILALEAWKLQHGSLPKTLDELVGTCLERIPVEPYSGKPFRYFPDGPKFSFQTNNPFKQLHWNQDQGNPDLISISISISANSPFLWATGPMVGNRNGYTDNKLILNEYRIFTNYGSYESGWYTPHSENDLLQAGWTFPIP